VIRVKGLSIQQGAFELNDVSFEVPSQSYAVLMGRSGCGKTTILESICGLRPMRAGQIELSAGVVVDIQGDNVNIWPPGDREIGYVPQDGALFPTMTVAGNIGFALAVRQWEPGAVDDRVNELADWLGIAHLLKRMPAGLSGGEAQRVALGRALAPSPSTLCLDEPLSALDDETRQEMYSVLRRIQEKAHVTTLHITHSRSEAQNLADTLFVLENGQLISQPIAPTVS
jgi:molybdate/tungstate transport system ATP-binding protein